MRRSALIFLAAILLPSLVLAWLAAHSLRDQQVVLEHQEVLISQGITDTLAKNVQDQMNQVRTDFTGVIRQLLNETKGTEPDLLATNFDRRLRDTWPMAKIGFAVNLNGDIYSPRAYDGPAAKIFREENDRFLSNRENVEVYASKVSSLTKNSSNSASSSLADLMGQKNEQESRKKADDQITANLPARQDELSDSDISATTPADKPAPSLKTKTKDTTDGYLRDSSAGTDSIPKTPVAAGTAVKKSAKTPVDSLAKSGNSHAEENAAANLPGGAADSDTLAIPLAAPVTAAPMAPLPAASAPAPMPTKQVEEKSVLKESHRAVQAPEVATLDSQVQMKMARNVIPQKMLVQQDAPLSNTLPEDSDFRRIIGSETNGLLARFLENKLRLMVWSRAPDGSPIVFGAQLDETKLIAALKPALEVPELEQTGSYSRSGGGNYCAAILDDTGKPVALSRPGFTADWKHPFVATEIGEALPHWEAALYLVDPQKITRTARTLQITLGLIVLVLVAAIVSGGSLIAADIRRQVRLAQQKTDFVSNVSHELKTPLTSIRMFADLLAEKRVPDEERQATYLRIIAAEAARLTRLINNVLDFARLERGVPPGEHRSCDLVEAVRDVIETCGPHLEAAGIAFRHEIEAESLPIHGDRDALAQIILNLVSNAEKYGGGDITVRVRRQETAAGALGCVDVLDRGPGIPARDVKIIFEAFHRLDDSLANGIPGSGLGLTLARRMARGHGGDVTCSPRAGGGSCFTLSVPLTGPGKTA